MVGGYDFLVGLFDREPRLMMRMIVQQAGDTGRHGPRLSPIVVLDYPTNAGARRFAEIMRSYLPKDEESNW